MEGDNEVSIPSEMQSPLRQRQTSSVQCPITDVSIPSEMQSPLRPLGVQRHRPQFQRFNPKRDAIPFATTCRVSLELMIPKFQSQARCNPLCDSAVPAISSNTGVLFQSQARCNPLCDRTGYLHNRYCSPGFNPKRDAIPFATQDDTILL